MSHLRLLLLSCLALMLLACTNLSGTSRSPYAPALSQPSLTARWAHHKQTIDPITRWKLIGKAAITSGHEGGTVSITWTQNANTYDLELYGFLGHGRTRLHVTPAEARLYTAEGGQWVSTDTQSLLGAYTGWYLPIEHLFYWIRGLPSTTATVQSLHLNSAGQLTELQQAGWTITYSDYMVVEGPALPKRLTLKHPGNTQHPEIVVKWLSKIWVIPVYQ